MSNAVRTSNLPAIKPQLASPAERVPTGDHWLHEIKFDGYRLMCFVRAGTARLMTRSGHDWTHRFPEVAAAIGELKMSEAILDGELIAVDASGRSTFNAMQRALRVSRQRQLQIHLFDVPYCSGFDLRRTPLIERKTLLQRMIARRSKATSNIIHFSDHVIGHGERMFREACERGLEGTISKRVDSEYVSMRSSSWLKNKCTLRQEFVIAGFSVPQGSRTGFGALVVGHYSDGELVYCGRVGTGFDELTLKSLASRLRTMEQRSNPFDQPPAGADAKGVKWIQPKLVAEVEFSQWTEDGRLRHPSFVGLREDKPATEVVREAPMHSKTKTSSKRSKRESANGDSIAGVTLTNPQRVMFPDVKITKRDLAEYYRDIAEWILPHVTHRPITIVRCPKGLSAKCFYQRHLTSSLPQELSGVSIREGQTTVQYIVVEDLAGLVSLIQHSALELHPWGAMADDVEHPNRLVFDLDPGPGVKWKQVIDAARRTRDVLAAAKLTSFVQTSGGKGLHVVVPVKPSAGWSQAKAFCEAVARFMASEEPARYTATLSKAKRKGRIFVDYLRNTRGATSVAPYSTRARPGAPVATPLRWDELGRVSSADTFTVKNLRKRLASLKADPWDGMLQIRQSIPSSAP